MSRKTRNDTLSDEGQKRINMNYLPSWNDDNMPSLSDNTPTDEGRCYCPDSEPFDANQIDDDFFERTSRRSSIRSIRKDSRRENATKT